MNSIASKIGCAGETLRKWVRQAERDQGLRDGMTTGARHKAANGVCTQVGDHRFAWFATTASKSRLNFLSLLGAGHGDYVVNAAALDYMRKRRLPVSVIALLAAGADKRFTDEGAWTAHLGELGITALKVHPNPARIATEGALWGSVVEHGFLKDAVIVSDDAGQFNVGHHALCWVHAERLIHKLVGFNKRQRQAIERIRAWMWRFYKALKAYCRDPTPRRKTALDKRFERLFSTRTGFTTLDRLLERYPLPGDQAQDLGRHPQRRRSRRPRRLPRPDEDLR